MQVQFTEIKDDLTKGLQNMITAFASKKTILGELGNEMANIVRSNFGTSGNYRGNTWPRYSKSYAKKIGSSIPTLLRSGTLKNSIRVTGIDTDTVNIGTNVIYASAQNFGSLKMNIPSRLFFPIDKNNLIKMNANNRLVLNIRNSLKILSNGVIS